MIADLVQDITATAGSGDIALSGSPTAGFQALSALGGVGTTFGYWIGAGSEWEVGTGTITAANTFSRIPSASSNGGALVAFSAGTKTFRHVVTASQFNQFAKVRQIAFTTTMPLTDPGNTYMPQQNVTSALAFTPAASPVQGALVYLRLVADGANVPTFSGFKEWGASLGYDNRAGISNEVQFFFDGYDFWYSITQAVGAVPEPVAATAVTMTGPTAGIVNTASSDYTVGTNGTRSGSVTVTPTPVTGVVFAPSSVMLPAGTSSATFTATSNATGAKIIVATNNGGLANPTSITLTVAAAATAPGAPTIGTATGGDTTMVQAGTAPASDGGSAITGYQLKVYKVSDDSLVGTFTSATLPVTATGLANGVAVYGKLAAANVVNTGAQSAASNSVTPNLTAVRMGSLLRMVESGTGPYTYTGTGGAFGSNEGDSVGLLALQAGVDGQMTIRLNTAAAVGGNEVYFGVDSSSANQGFAAINFGMVGHTSGYSALRDGNADNTVATPGAVGDYLRLMRTDEYLRAAYSKDNGATWAVLQTWAVSTGVLYFHCLATFQGSFTPISTSGLA